MLTRTIIATLLISGSIANAATFPPLSPTDRLAAGKVAGFSMKGGKLFNECEDNQFITFNQVDLNGDGKAELIVSDGGACYGQMQGRFSILQKQPKGGWKELWSEGGTAQVLKTKHLGWLDIEAGQPGFGHMPVARWNGKAYIAH